jgi:hypothetical protein
MTRHARELYTVEAQGRDLPFIVTERGKGEVAAFADAEDLADYLAAAQAQRHGTCCIERRRREVTA